MSFSTAAEFFHMGGHGLYVWTAYGIGFAVLLIHAAQPFFAKKRFLRDYQREQVRRQRREQPSDNPPA